MRKLKGSEFGEPKVSLEPLNLHIKTETGQSINPLFCIPLMYIRLCTWLYMLRLFSAIFNPASTRSVSWFWAEGSRRMSSVDARGHPRKYLDVLLDLFWLHGLSLESEPPWLCLVTTLRRSMPRPSLPKIALAHT